jgi:putative flippase GtrA
VYLVSWIRNLLWKHDMIGFLAIGGITSLLNLVIFALSIEIGLSSYLAVAIGNSITTIVYFIGLSKLFSGPGSVRSIARFLLSVVTYFFVSIALLDAINGILDNLVWSRAISIAIAAPINYFAQKYFVFRN